MRILHVIVGLSDAWGGPPRALATLARAQAARGDDVVVLPCAATDGPQTLDPGRYDRLTVLAPPATGQLRWYSPRVKRQLRRAGRDRDIVHVHGTWRYHVLASASAARGYGIPFIVRPAGNLGEVCRNHKYILKKPYFELIERRVLNRAAAIHCTSQKEARELMPLELHPRAFIVPQPIEIGSNGAAADFDGLDRACPQLRGAEGVIAYLGRISHLKRADLLLEAFVQLSADFPGWRLVLAGPPEDAAINAALHERVQQTGLAGQVELPGMLRGSMKSSLLARASIFAQPSLHENFGISVAEALLAGVPCVVSSGVALAEDVVASGAGLSGADDLPSLVERLRRLMSDSALRQQQSRNAAELARRFDPAIVADRIDAEYRLCLAGGSDATIAHTPMRTDGQ